MTTSQNIQSSKIRLDTTALSETVQDAITVTRGLGFHLLWIDALCILQDSDEDKEQQIPKMGDIYNNAAVTIYVATARGVHEGFLKRRVGSSRVCGHLSSHWIASYDWAYLTLCKTIVFEFQQFNPRGTSMDPSRIHTVSSPFGLYIETIDLVR